MSRDPVDQIARAVLYEGYLLYPYRPSALKNKQRWNFGVLYPPAWAATQTGSDRSYLQMECVTRCSGETRLTASVRFLEVAQGQEAIEHGVEISPATVADLTEAAHSQQIAIANATKGHIEVSANGLFEDVFRVTARVCNTSGWGGGTRDDALLHSLASAHVVLHLDGGEFVSQIDPPEELREAIAGCQNTGVWPVLVGSPYTMLGSPIILYDYPQIAPESKGDLFDATEIDEILTLRILTLTDEEKEEVRRSDGRARRLLERLEASPQEHLLELHGTMRGVRQTVAGMVTGPAGFKQGDRVRLKPRHRADIFDTLLEGKIAIIEAVEEDFEGKLHYAVVIEDDPGRDMGEIRQIGHRFFFSTEEVEPVEAFHEERKP